MKYYPLEVVDKMEETERPEEVLKSMKEQGMCDQDATVKDLEDYTFGFRFFSPMYMGKFKNWNMKILTDEYVNKIYFPMYKMEQIEERQTEWKDVLSIGQVLNKWKQFKMVYKIDNDFFHEIKKTDNIVTSYDMFQQLPFDCFFIDLTEVKDIADFRGVWVYIRHETHNQFSDFIGVNIYMVRGDEQTFFTYYSWYNFTEESEIAWKQEDLPDSDFVARSIGLTEDELLNGYFNSLNDEYVEVAADHDPRKEIIATVFQIMAFVAIDASDVSENPTTKQTYKPHKEGSRIKNKFSEVRMWDVGVKYGKAIRVAKQEYKKHIERERSEQKDRKPVRPHIRRAHWHKYHVGEGRKETKTLWLAPVYVCGSGKEIPVTIREVKK